MIVVMPYGRAGQSTTFGPAPVVVRAISETSRSRTTWFRT